jgi:threonine synthase
METWPGIIERYRPWLPVTHATPVVTLGEGGTPLRFAPYLSERVGAEVYLKLEGTNPTGSFKDRGMTVAVSRACEAGAEVVLCASTGNTSASAAAYAARAGLRAVVLVPSGAIAYGKLAQALVYGAEVAQIAGSFDDALAIVRALEGTPGLIVVNSINPDRLEGQKTAAFEVVEQLGRAPDVVAIPVGNAGNISAWWRGFKEWHGQGRADRLPRMLGFQAAGAAPLVEGRTVAHPQTVATAIRIGNPASAHLARQALDESRGAIKAVSDEEILAAYILLARHEAVFCEPASAAPVAGLLQSSIPAGSLVVCVLTGNGLKDPETAVGQARPPLSCGATLDEVKRALAL